MNINIRVIEKNHNLVKTKNIPILIKHKKL